MGYESGRVAGIDHAAGHGDPDAGRTISDPGAAAGLFGWHSGGGFRASVRQGDRDGPKGVYPINAVDCCVARFEAVATCERISEAYLIPVLEALLHNFPFVIRGFHGDNGSEYINRHVAEVLDKLLIDEHANSRFRRSNDNARAESKNGSIVGKHFGYSHIPQRLARVVKDLCREHPNPRLNLHRPCLSAETITDSKRHRRKRYPCQLMMTPYEKFKSLPEAAQYLKPGISLQALDALAASSGDNEAMASEAVVAIVVLARVASGAYYAAKLEAGAGSSRRPALKRRTASRRHSSEETAVKSRLSVALPGAALALLAIAAAQAAPPSPRPPPARATEPASMAAKQLSALEARMRLMQEQMRRIRATKSPEVRARLLREHMHTMMRQMQAMRAMGGPMMSGMMRRGMMGGISMGHGMAGGGNRQVSGAKRHPWSENRMPDHMQDRLAMMRMMMEQNHMQDRLDMMQMMMGQMMDQMQAMQGMQGMMTGGKGPRR